MYLSAETLVINIVSAEGISMCEQRLRVIKVNQRRVAQQRGTAGMCKFRAYQQIAVAMHDVYVSAMDGKCMQGIDNLAMKRIVDVIIASPVFEQVTEYVECLRFRRNLSNKAEKYLCTLGLFRAKMKVRNKETVGHGRAGFLMKLHKTG